MRFATVVLVLCAAAQATVAVHAQSPKGTPVGPADAPSAARSYDEQLARSRAAALERRYEDAVSAAEAAIRLDDRRFEAYVLAASAYSSQRLYDDAIGMLQMALVRAPEDKKPLVRDAIAEARAKLAGPAPASKVVATPAASSKDSMEQSRRAFGGIWKCESPGEPTSYMRLGYSDGTVTFKGNAGREFSYPTDGTTQIDIDGICASQDQYNWDGVVLTQTESSRCKDGARFRTTRRISVRGDLLTDEIRTWSSEKGESQQITRCMRITDEQYQADLAAPRADNVALLTLLRKAINIGNVSLDGCDLRWTQVDGWAVGIAHLALDLERLTVRRGSDAQGRERYEVAVPTGSFVYLDPALANQVGETWVRAAKTCSQLN